MGKYDREGSIKTAPVSTDAPEPQVYQKGHHTIKYKRFQTTHIIKIKPSGKMSPITEFR